MKTSIIKKLGIGMLFTLITIATIVVVKNNLKVIKHECITNATNENEALFLSLFH